MSFLVAGTIALGALILAAVGNYALYRVTEDSTQLGLGRFSWWNIAHNVKQFDNLSGLQVENYNRNIKNFSQNENYITDPNVLSVLGLCLVRFCGHLFHPISSLSTSQVIPYVNVDFDVRDEFNVYYKLKQHRAKSGQSTVIKNGSSLSAMGAYNRMIPYFGPLDPSIESEPTTLDQKTLAFLVQYAALHGWVATKITTNRSLTNKFQGIIIFSCKDSDDLSVALTFANLGYLVFSEEGIPVVTIASAWPDFKVIFPCERVKDNYHFYELRIGVAQPSNSYNEAIGVSTALAVVYGGGRQTTLSNELTTHSFNIEQALRYLSQKCTNEQLIAGVMMCEQLTDTPSTAMFDRLNLKVDPAEEVRIRGRIEQLKSRNNSD